MTPSPHGSRTLGPSTAVGEREATPFYLDDLKQRVTVVRSADRLFAFDDLCPHDRAPLSSGMLTKHCIMCPCDGSLFELESGDVVHGPALAPLATYEVVERDGVLLIAV